VALAGDDGVGLEVEQEEEQKEKLHVFFCLIWVGLDFGEKEEALRNTKTFGAFVLDYMWMQDGS
jgi:hypothetical protein